MDESIKDIIRGFGLDPKKMTLVEPAYDRLMNAMLYRMEYRDSGHVYDWNFTITRDDVERGKEFIEARVLRFVHDGCLTISGTIRGVLKPNLDSRVRGE